jgi:protein gp37
MQKTKIPYLNYNWGITHGCEPISSGCNKCWAKVMSKRLAGAKIKGYDAVNPFKPVFMPDKLLEPLQLKKPSVIGISFMGDLFIDDITYEQIMQVFDVMIGSIHTFVICTKRPENIVSLFRSFEDLESDMLDNVWFGCTIENNKELLNRIGSMDILHNDYDLHTWVSIEPLLEDISENFLKGKLNSIFDWIVIGGESGAGARFCNPEWIDNIRSLVPKEKFYFKQLGTNKENVNDGVDMIQFETYKSLPFILNK